MRSHGPPAARSPSTSAPCPLRRPRCRGQADAVSAPRRVRGHAGIRAGGDRRATIPDCARLICLEYPQRGLPTWIIGPTPGPGPENLADILQGWPIPQAAYTSQPWAVQSIHALAGLLRAIAIGGRHAEHTSAERHPIPTSPTSHIAPGRLLRNASSTRPWPWRHMMEWPRRQLTVWPLGSMAGWRTD